LEEELPDAAGRRGNAVEFLGDAEIISSASLVITHAGVGTIMAALGRGVPVLCTPLGRDQFFNAERVQRTSAPVGC
jgi:UDP:flavonoid glycosyltransferase YjiC (YdhE family)